MMNALNPSTYFHALPQQGGLRFSLIPQLRVEPASVQLNQLGIFKRILYCVRYPDHGEADTKKS